MTKFHCASEEPLNRDACGTAAEAANSNRRRALVEGLSEEQTFQRERRPYSRPQRTGELC